MDRVGIDAIVSFEDRVNTVATMCERGHAGKMVLSHDAACFNHWLPERLVPTYMPNWHYLHIHNDVIPALRMSNWILCWCRIHGQSSRRPEPISALSCLIWFFVGRAPSPAGRAPGRACSNAAEAGRGRPARSGGTAPHGFSSQVR